MSLVARHLEANGIATLCLGSALDILTAGHPPRAAFVDYPLGHSAGKPFDKADQYRVVAEGLAAFDLAAPGIKMLAGSWDADPDWQDKAMRADAGDLRQPRDETPRYQFEADRLLAEG